MLNPVLRREIQTSLRSRKVYGAIFFYVLALIAVAACVFWSEIFNSYDLSFDPASISALYALLAVMQLFLIAVIVPAITGGSISGEKERQTFDLMLVSKMHARSIITGKLLASIGIVILMIIASAPVFAVAIQFGGATVKDVFLLMLYFIAFAVFLGALSIFFSALIKKTAVSMVIVYIITAFLCVGTIVVFTLYYEYISVGGTITPNATLFKALMGINPIVSVLAVLESQTKVGLSSIFPFNNMFSETIRYSSIWLINIVFYIVVSAAAVIFASKVIDPIKNTKIHGHR